MNGFDEYGYNGLSNWRTSRIYRPSGQRPHFPQGRHKPDYDKVYWKLKFYSEEDDSMAKERGKSSLYIDYLREENTVAHRTELYGVQGLVLRRGQSFKIRVEIKVPFDPERDRLRFLFSKGDKPQESKGTLVRVDVSPEKSNTTDVSKDYWSAHIASLQRQNTVTMVDVIINTPPDALVGRYHFQIKLFVTDSQSDEPRTITKDEMYPLYLLFNAWCKDDQVYMDREDERFEYVLNETGRIWVGKASRNCGRPWNYGQFSRYSLDSAIELLEKSKTIHDQGHGNATLVVRAISAMGNKCSDTDDGVLVGNWSGKYEGGTSPTQWNGSQAILQEYVIKRRQVQFGQCWVFSGLLTTIGRTLGIPTRPVTNFESAHDKDVSMTIDSHYDLNGKPLSSMDDSVWNFHVWNESWFKRPDLPEGYDGWQAFDATPQECSDGIYRCGPAPVKAIKEGNVYLGYDTKFIFAEVNGDRMTWMVVPSSGDMYSLSDKTQTECVGKNISTKMIGSNDRNDITDNYKYPEGSREERQSVARASRFSSRQKELLYVYPQNKSDVKFNYNGETQQNGDVNISLHMENTAEEERVMTLSFTLHAAYYTGIPAEELCHDNLKIAFQPGESKDKKWCIQAKDYLNIIDEDAKLKLYLMANTAGTKQVFTKQDMFEIDKPELELGVSDRNPKIGDKFEVTMRMINPLSIKLTEGVLFLEGPGVQKHMKIPLHRSLNPGEELIKTVTLTAKYPGTREIIASFHSRQLTGITGAAGIKVEFRKAHYV